MRKVALLSSAVLLMTSMATACSEHVTRTEKNVQEKSSYSSTVRDTREPIAEQKYDSSSVEQRQRTITSDGIGGNMSSQEKVTTEKRRSETSAPGSDESSVGAAQDYNQESEFHQHTRTEVTK
jgi:hypothetical protein